MFEFSPVHLLIFAVVVLLVMGPKRLPGMARSLGHGLREFRGSLAGPTELEPFVGDAPAEGPAGDPRP